MRRRCGRCSTRSTTRPTGALLEGVLDRFEDSRGAAVAVAAIAGDPRRRHAGQRARRRARAHHRHRRLRRHEPHRARLRPVSSAIESLLVHRPFADVVPVAMRSSTAIGASPRWSPRSSTCCPTWWRCGSSPTRCCSGGARRCTPTTRTCRTGRRLLALARLPRGRGRGGVPRAPAARWPVVGRRATLTERRTRAFGPALSPLTYDRPLHLVRGEGVWLIDADGERFLDCYNNVPVVGHAHPRVADAIARQSRTAEHEHALPAPTPRSSSPSGSWRRCPRGPGSTRCCS